MGSIPSYISLHFHHVDGETICLYGDPTPAFQTLVASELEGFANAVANAENGMQTFRPTAQWSPSELRGLSEPVPWVPSTKVAWTAQAVCKISWSVMRCVEAHRQGRWWAMESYKKRLKKYISWTLAMIFFVFAFFFPHGTLISELPPVCPTLQDGPLIRCHNLLGSFWAARPSGRKKLRRGAACTWHPPVEYESPS